MYAVGQARLSAYGGDERTLADAWLDFHRQTLLWKCGGLTAQQLKLRAVERSNLSLLGLVRHMAEVERDWFRARFAGAKAGYLYCSDDGMNAEFDVATADAESDLAPMPARSKPPATRPSGTRWTRPSPTRSATPR
jgi:hypothetical protein